MRKIYSSLDARNDVLKKKKKCIICRSKVPSENIRVCNECRNTHKIHDELPSISVEYIGSDIDQNCNGYKYFSFLFDSSDLELTNKDLNDIEEKVEFSSILGNEDDVFGDDDHYIYFYMSLISHSTNFVKNILHYFDFLMGPAMMAVLFVNKKYCQKTACSMISNITKTENVVLGIDH